MTLPRHPFANFLYDSKDRVLPWLRRGLGLPAQPPDGPHSIYTTPSGTNGMVTVHQHTDEETEKLFQQWHHAGRRERFAEDVWARLHDSADHADHLLERLDFARGRQHRQHRHQLERELREARHINYRTWHGGYSGSCDHLDGFIQLPSGRYQLDLSTVGYVQHWAREAWSWGGADVLGVDREPDCSRRIVVPAPVLTHRLCEQALLRWYMERYEYDRGHWAVLAKQLPTFSLSTGLALPDTREQRAACGKATMMAERDLQHMDSPRERERMWSRFGYDGSRNVFVDTPGD